MVLFVLLVIGINYIIFIYKCYLHTYMKIQNKSSNTLQKVVSRLLEEKSFFYSTLSVDNTLNEAS